MHVIYHTPRLDLRILRPGQEDIVLNFYERNRAFLEPLEPLRAEHFYTLEYQRSNLSCEYNSFVKFNYLRFWLFDKANPFHAIGTISFSNFRKGAFGSCMLGYKLDQSACHQGYMSEALSSLIPKVFQEYHLHRLEAMVMPGNTASIRLLERLGFIREGYLHSFAQIHGKWCDHLLYTYLGPSNNTSV